MEILRRSCDGELWLLHFETVITDAIVLRYLWPELADLKVPTFDGHLN